MEGDVWGGGCGADIMGKMRLTLKVVLWKDDDPLDVSGRLVMAS
jgi:hypothetical protein